MFTVGGCTYLHYANNLFVHLARCWSWSQMSKTPYRRMNLWKCFTVISSVDTTETIPPPSSQSSPYLLYIICKPANDVYAITFRQGGSMIMAPTAPRAFVADLSVPPKPRCLAQNASILARSASSRAATVVLAMLFSKSTIRCS